MRRPGRESCLVAGTILFVWLWMDFIALWLSVLCTYFYFGMYGSPYHFARIGGVALVSVSGAVVYKLFLQDRDRPRTFKIMLGGLVLLYFLLASYRGSDLFAWAVLLANVGCGIAAVALYRRLDGFANQEALLSSAMLGVVFYLAARLFNDGVLTLFRIDSLPGYVMLALLGLVAIAEGPRTDPLDRNSAPTTAAQLYAAAAGLLIGLSVTFLFNLSLWSARTPASPTSVYYGSLLLGMLAGILASRRIASGAAGSAALSIVVSICMGTGLYVVLYVNYDLAGGLIGHGVACFGTTVCWFLHARQYRASAAGSSRTIPVFGLVAGAIGFAAAVVYFLLYADPAGFSIALVLVCAITVAAELRGHSAELATSSDYKRLALFGLIATLPILLVLRPQAPGPTAVQPAAADPLQFSVMSSNVRYGWTDDYRFAPDEHLRWLEENPADIVGYQEVNKGSLYGAFTDMLPYYQSAIPGRTIYGDASFGFGNALSTRLPVKDSRVVPFTSSDMIQRSYIWALLELDEREIEVFVTHLSHLLHPNQIRREQVAELVAAIAKSRRPWILMGDFNALPTEPEISELKAISSAVFEQQPALLEEPSHPMTDPEIRIDYIFFSDHFELIEQQVVDTGGTSDHRPIRSWLKLKPTSAL